MRVLLDECVDARLSAHIVGHEAKTVHDEGWSGITNGKLLALAEKKFDVFVTIDSNLAFQQNIPRFAISVILVHCVSNRLNDLLKLLPQLTAAIPTASKGKVTDVGG